MDACVRQAIGFDEIAYQGEKAVEVFAGRDPCALAGVYGASLNLLLARLFAIAPERP